MCWVNLIGVEGAKGESGRWESCTRLMGEVMGAGKAGVAFFFMMHVCFMDLH